LNRRNVGGLLRWRIRCEGPEKRTMRKREAQIRNPRLIMRP
jgi:hypothetical protein